MKCLPPCIQICVWTGETERETLTTEVLVQLHKRKTYHVISSLGNEPNLHLSIQCNITGYSCQLWWSTNCSRAIGEPWPICQFFIFLEPFLSAEAKTVLLQWEWIKCPIKLRGVGEVGGMEHPKAKAAELNCDHPLKSAECWQGWRPFCSSGVCIPAASLDTHWMWTEQKNESWGGKKAPEGSRRMLEATGTGDEMDVGQHPASASGWYHHLLCI